MELTLLGTGNPLPDADRAGAATLVRAGGLTLLIDAGRGVLLRLAAAGVLPMQLSAVLLTHLHSDHICDLNDVVTSHWVMSQVPRQLRIFGPPGTAGVVDGMLKMLEPDVGYRIAHHDDLTQGPDLAVTNFASDTFREAQRRFPVLAEGRGVTVSRRCAERRWAGCGRLVGRGRGLRVLLLRSLPPCRPIAPVRG